MADGRETARVFLMPSSSCLRLGPSREVGRAHGELCRVIMGEAGEDGEEIRGGFGAGRMAADGGWD